MGIIYSYPKQTVLQNTDLLIGTRFSTEPGVVPRSISFSIETLTEYINASAPIPTLDQVLNEGNVSLLDAQVGSIYLYDDFTVPGYLSIRGFKDRVYFYSKSDKSYGYITQDSLVLKDELSDYEFTIKKANSIESNHTATFQNTSGTVAYLDDILTLSLDRVLDNGNSSLQSAYIGELGLFDIPNEGYAKIGVSDSVFNFYDHIGDIVTYISDSGIGIKRGSFTGVLTTSVLTADRQYTMPDKTGTVALLSDIPVIPASNNYGLAAQIASSTNIVNTTVESTLISNEYEGTLSVPANSFVVGDSFKVSLMGHINCLSSATLHIRIKTSAGVLLADTGVIDLEAATAKHWKLDIEFTIRQIGGEGIASVVSGGSFSYNKNASNNPESITFISINNSDFNTTISNELAITAQWNNANSSNAIYSDIFTLNKVY